MATRDDPAFEAFLEEARRRAIEEGPIPERVLNELKILLLVQRRELRADTSIATMFLSLDGLEWRTRWLLPAVLHRLAGMCESYAPFGLGVGNTLLDVANRLTKGDWDLAVASELLRAPLDQLHDMGAHPLPQDVDPRPFRRGRRGADELRIIAARNVDLAALGLELAVVAWARVLGVQDAWIDLVAHGYSQSEARDIARSASFLTDTVPQLAQQPVVTPIPSEWSYSTTSGD